MTQRHARGRPAATTCDAIEEAATELFLEQGYDATSVADIARRAGVSRSSFFNYLDGKADVLWGPVVRVLDGADAAFDAATRAHGDDAAGSAHDAVAIVRAALVDLARGVDASCIPPAVTQAELMGARQAVLETGAVLLLERTARLRERLGALAPDADEVWRASLAASAVGAAAAACTAWMRAGTGRGPLAPIVERALGPALAGYESAGYESAGHESAGHESARYAAAQ